MKINKSNILRIALLLCIAICNFSCQEEEEIQENTIVGEWLFVTSTGGWQGEESPSSINSDNYIKFTTDGLYFDYRSDTIYFQSTYFTYQEVADESSQNFFKIEASFTKAYFFKPDTLVYYISDVSDIPYTYFVRK